jgi:hypothetical protein
LKALKTKVEAQALLKEDRDKEEKAEKELKEAKKNIKSTCLEKTLIDTSTDKCTELKKAIKTKEIHLQNKK